MSEPSVVLLEGGEWVFQQAFYASHHHRRAAFQKIVRWSRTRHASVAVASGEFDGRPAVILGVSAVNAPALATVPWGPDALLAPVPEVVAEMVWRRHQRVAESASPGLNIQNHDAEAAQGRSYLRPDGTLGEKV